MRGLSRLKPGASIKTHLLVAALLWSFIGVYLVVRGGLLYRTASLWPLLPAIGLGLLKSRLVLDRTARRNTARLAARQDGGCIGGVYSWRMWGLIVLMMVGGRLLRASGLSGLVVGFVYVAVGTALCRSSRLLWQQWQSVVRPQ